MSQQKTTRLNQYQIEDKQLSRGLSLNQKLFIGGLLFVAFVGVAYSLFSVGSIKLLSPKNSSGLAAKDLAFSWKCSKPDTKLVLEVFDGEKLVMRQLVKGDSYTPDDDQKRDLKADKSYKWRVVADPDVAQKYSFNVESAIFYITKAMPPPVVVAPKPVETPSKPSKPLPEEELPKKDSVKPPFYD